ncbi:MAG: helix-turn-helix domain-containing protein [Planctomycetales bacterium]
MSDPMPPPLLVTTREAARLLAVSERTLLRIRDAGELRAVRLPRGGLRYAVADLERYIARQLADADATPAPSVGSRDGGRAQ